MSRIFRILLGFIASAITAYIIGTALNTQFVISGHGVPVGLGDRLNMTAFDISNMRLYLPVILLGFAIAFLIASVLKRFLPSFASIAYPLAGAAAIGGALGLMYLNFQTVPISGARGTYGFIAQMLAGALGGYVFAKLGHSKPAT